MIRIMIDISLLIYNLHYNYKDSVSNISHIFQLYMYEQQ